LKLLLDENISPEVTELLRSRAYDVKSIRECCKGYEDEKVVEIAVRETRVIVTFDLDFGELYHNLGASSIIMRLRTRKPPVVFKHLHNFLQSVEKKNMDLKNKLSIVTEGKVRIIG
jgi:predicted nuclease of predicted toxin-antitoxin system